MDVKTGNITIRLFFLFCIAFNCLNLSHAESISNVSLQGVSRNNIAIIGQNINISWLPNVESRQSIVLQKNRLPVKTIASNLDTNTSAYRWKVANIEPGNSYRIMVITRDNTYGVSQEFNIHSLNKKNLSRVNKPSNIKDPSTMAPAIIVRQPEKGLRKNIYAPLQKMEGLTHPTDLAIKWIKTGQQQNRVRILLISKDRNWSRLISQSTRNDGQEVINLSNVQPGNYIIRVQGRSTKNKVIKGDSKIFQIVNEAPNFFSN